MLIVLEGIDGSGKTTLAYAIRDRLVKLGLKAQVTSEFGRNESWSVEGKAELLNARNKREEYKAVMRTRLKHASEVLDKSKPENIVLMDRYLPSTIAYQSSPTQTVWNMHSDHINNALPVPAIVFYIRIKPELAQSRRQLRGGQDAIDSRGVEYFQEVNDRFLAGLDVLSKAHNWQYRVISGDQHISDLVKDCVDMIMGSVNQASKVCA